MKKTTGILLAGGLSRRFGSPKAFAEWGNHYFYEHVYHRLKQQCDHVVIVTRQVLLPRFPSELDVVTDIAPYEACGPLAGIYTGMLTSSTANYLVLPCDMPLIQEEALSGLIKRHEGGITAVELAGQLQPLVSVWSRGILEDVRKALDWKQYAMQQFLRQQDLKIVDAAVLSNNPMTFLNINTSTEEKEMREWQQ